MLNFKPNNLTCEIPQWLTDKADPSLMLWAGDCVQNGLADVERLPGYDVYLCNGFNHIHTNLAIQMQSKRPFCICVLDIHDLNQLNHFTQLFKGIFQTINSDYHGNTPSLSIHTYKDLLKVGGSAYNTEGINAVFFPSIAFRDTLELFAPVLPDYLKPRRKWTKEMLQLAKDNDLSISAAWTSPDLLNPYYKQIRNDQNMFDDAQVRRYPNQQLYNLNYTAETIETYWDTLPTLVLLSTPERGLRWENIDETWLLPFKPRLIAYLENKIKMSLSEVEKEDFLAFYATRSETPEDQLAALQKAMGVINISKDAMEGLNPVIRYYKDARREEPDETVFGVIFSKV